MNWKTKVALHWLISRGPARDRLHYGFQRYVRKSIPCRYGPFVRRAERFTRHLERLREVSGERLGGRPFFEFGAGWDLAGAIFFRSSGITEQVLIDIRPWARVELVNQSITHVNRLCRESAGGGAPSFTGLTVLEGGAIRSLSELDRLGITYDAPRDARGTGLPAESVDHVTSSTVLEYVPPVDVPRVFGEMQRILRPGGLFSMQIGYEDNYSYFDRSITIYNFLRYSPETWRRFNPPTHYQNRLRHPAYIDALESAGFEVLSVETRDPTPEDLAALDRTPIHESFRQYSRDAIAIRGAHIVCRRR